MSPIWVMGGLCACFETDTTKCLNKDPSSFGICYGAPVTPEVAMDAWALLLPGLGCCFRLKTGI